MPKKSPSRRKIEKLEAQIAGYEQNLSSLDMRCMSADVTINALRSNLAEATGMLRAAADQFFVRGAVSTGEYCVAKANSFDAMLKPVPCTKAPTNEEFVKRFRFDRSKR